MRKIRQLAGMLRIVIRLGPWQALKLLVLAPRSKEIFPISVNGYSQPISIRGKTSDLWVLHQVILCEEYAGFVPMRPSRILDGGANIGLATLYWKKCFPEAEIVAVEPDADNLKLLRANTQHLEGVSLIHGGLWSKSTQLSLSCVDGDKWAIRVFEDDNGSIAAHSIGSIMESKGWDWIDVVKLDVEGSEVTILAEDNLEWISKIGTLIIEIHQDIEPDAARVLFKAFSEQHFRLTWRGENLVLTRRQDAATGTGKRFLGAADGGV